MSKIAAVSISSRLTPTAVPDDRDGGEEVDAQSLL